MEHHVSPAVDFLPEPKLLLLFDTLYRTRSVTRAAASLGQEQPTVSIWLGKLRERFGDPLFVRTSSGMQPTPRAEALADPVRRALEQLRALAGTPATFEPARSQRRFHVGMSDAAHITLLPRLLAFVRASAPGVGIDVGYLGAATAQALESGAMDLAIGFLPQLASGYHEQTLFAQDFVCLVDAAHPRVGRTLTRRRYGEEAHVGLELSGTGHDVVERAMERHRIVRRVAVRVPGFLGLAAIVASTDLIATVPRQIGQTLAEGAGVRFCECPVPVPGYTVKQHWHTRFHEDPGHRWLRRSCAALFGTHPRTASR